MVNASLGGSSSLSNQRSLSRVRVLSDNRQSPVAPQPWELGGAWEWAAQLGAFIHGGRSVPEEFGSSGGAVLYPRLSSDVAIMRLAVIRAQWQCVSSQRAR